MSGKYQYYTESGQFDLIRTVAGCIILVFVTSLLGYLYTVISVVFPLVYFLVVWVVLFAFVLGKLALVATHLLHVRNRSVRLFLAIFIALLASYFQWGVYFLFVQDLQIPSYSTCMSAIFSREFGTFAFLMTGEIVDVGVASIRGVPINRGFQITLWLLEVFTFFAVPVLMVLTLVPKPFSEKVGRWYRKFKLDTRFGSVFSPKVIVPQIQADILEALDKLGSGPSGATIVSVYYLENADKQYLWIEREVHGRSLLGTKFRTILPGLMIGSDQAQLLFKEFGKKLDRRSLVGL